MDVALVSTEMTPEPGAPAVAPASPELPSNLEQLTVLVTQCAALFYLVESPVNPQIASYWDALHNIATSLSVGYANLFPVTPMGKAIGAAVMMIGPALSARALDAPAAPDAVAGKLEEILIELRRLNAR